MKSYPNFKSLILAAFIGFSTAAAAQRVTRNFNSDRTFRAPGEVDRGKTTRVQLPHTWNAQDALSGDIHYLRGTGNYTKTFVAPKEWEGRRVFVRFRGEPPGGARHEEQEAAQRPMRPMCVGVGVKSWRNVFLFAKIDISLYPQNGTMARNQAALAQW